MCVKVFGCKSLCVQNRLCVKASVCKSLCVQKSLSVKSSVYEKLYKNTMQTIVLY